MLFDMESVTQKQSSTPKLEQRPTQDLLYVYQSGSGTNATDTQRTESTQPTETLVTENSTVNGSRIISARILDPNDNDRAIHQILDRWDVAALIINKMVGSGIFTGPPLVLLYTQHKVEAMFLWILGLIYTYLCMLMYLGYAEALPFIGGELIYLDAIFSKPKMFFYTLYGVAFVFLMNGTTNCLQFGAQVLRADLKEPDNDPRLVRLFAVCILTLVCFALAYSNSLFRTTNKVFAGFKVVVMLVLFIGGVLKAADQKDITFGRVHQTSNEPSVPALNHFLALSSVLFAYNGWENATFVQHPSNSPIHTSEPIFAYM
ncbi:amino acid permease-domain-containing protein [Tirmania nivea]|nr:amino acid permease-domain-containing protein [Tirmania nivea]